MGELASRVPTDAEWAELGLVDVDELGGGHQSRVFSADRDEDHLAVKLASSALVDATELWRRVEIVAELARLDPHVVEPLPILEHLVHPWGDWIVTATRFAEGEPPDSSNLQHAELLGTTLAELHSSLAQVAEVELPMVAALRGVDVGKFGPNRLLHGDFNSSNIRLTAAGVRVFDFDDCGYGPIEFDVANALYMELFDAFVADQRSVYEQFRSSFLAGYNHATGGPISSTAIDLLLDMRIAALERWIDDPSIAPIGIRTADQEWLDVLRRFVATFGAG